MPRAVRHSTCPAYPASCSLADWPLYCFLSLQVVAAFKILTSDPQVSGQHTVRRLCNFNQDRGFEEGVRQADEQQLNVVSVPLSGGDVPNKRFPRA